MSTTHVTEHFSWAEAACHDGTPVPPELRPWARALALTVLEPVRARFGKPIVAVSWYRTPSYNQRVGGAQQSRHLQADAADIRPVALSDLPLLRACIEDMLRAGALPDLGGLGVYAGWVHVDIRQRAPDGHVARWRGALGIGSEVVG